MVLHWSNDNIKEQSIMDAIVQNWFVHRKFLDHLAVVNSTIMYLVGWNLRHFINLNELQILKYTQVIDSKYIKLTYYIIHSPSEYFMNMVYQFLH